MNESELYRGYDLTTTDTAVVVNKDGTQISVCDDIEAAYKFVDDLKRGEHLINKNYDL